MGFSKVFWTSFCKVFITLCVVIGSVLSYNFLLTQYPKPDNNLWTTIWGVGYLMGFGSFFVAAVMPIKFKGWKWWMSALFFIIFPALSYGIGQMIVKANSLAYGIIPTLSIGMTLVIAVCLATALITFLASTAFIFLLAYFTELKGYSFKGKIREIANDCAKPFGIILAILACLLLLYWFF